MIIKYFRLFESKLEYLESFETILKIMSSPISKSLLELSGKDLDLIANYIGVSNDDFVDFVPDNRSKDVRFVYRILVNSGFFPTDYGGAKEYSNFIQALGFKEWHFPSTGELIYQVKELDNNILSKYHPHLSRYKIYHYKSLNGDKDYIYLESNSYSLEKTNQIIGGKSQQIKIGRLAKALLKFVDQKFTDKEIELFVNEFKSKIELLKNSFRNFHLVSDEDIRDWYLEDNYYIKFSGTLHNSCMRYFECQEYFNIYLKNPEVCKLLILKSDFDQTKITGRALVWNLDNGDVFMDRVYYSKDMEIDLFVEYAKSKGWVYKKNQAGSGFMKDGKEYTKIVRTNLKKYEFEQYPYLDTLAFLSKDGVLSSVRIIGSRELRSTDGQYTGVGCEECDDGYIDCGDCDGRGQVDCESCGGDGKFDCGKCDGDGDLECIKCSGTGNVDEKICGDCVGTGEISCDECDGDGSRSCQDCDGDGQVDCDSCGGSGTTNCPECND